MVAVAYIIDQAVFATFFFGCAVFFILQLLVERQAKYDEQQLNEKLRVEDWRLRRLSSVQQRRESKEVRPPSLVPSPKSLPIATANTGSHNSDDHDSQSDSHVDGDDTIVKRGTSSPIQIVPRGSILKRRALRVGPIQKAFHRIGLAIALINCWRFIDPYGVLGVMPYEMAYFLLANSGLFIFLATIISFFYPIHLVRVVAFDTRTKPLEIIGGSVSFLTLCFTMIVPGMTVKFGQILWIRNILELWWAVSVTAVTCVFNYYMFLVSRSVAGLIGYHVTMANRLTTVPSALVPTININMAPVSPTSASQQSLQQSPSNEAQLLEQPNNAASNTEQPTAAAQSDNNDANILRQNSLSTDSNASESSSRYLLAPHSSSSRSTTPSQQSRHLSPHPEAKPITAGQSLAITIPPSNSSLPPVPPSPVGARPIDALPIAPPRRPSNQMIRQYTTMLRKMRIFQVIATIVASFVVLDEILVVLDGMNSSLFRIPEADDYSTGTSILLFTIAHCLAVLLLGWYAYMPISVLWTPTVAVEKEPASEP